MFLIVICRPHKNVSWMCVAMNESILKDHFGEYLNQVLCTLARIDSHLLNLFLLVYLCSCYELHCNDSLRTEFLIVFGNVNVGIVLK